MAPDESDELSEREQTDESLRVERQGADDALAAKLEALQDTADAVIARARERADAVLAAGRASADAVASEAPLSEIDRERRLEDRVVREERATADAVVDAERSEQAAAMLEIGRGATDKDLRHERSQSDQALATRDDFLGMVSHDLRNMLGSIVGYANLIERAEKGEVEHRPEVIALHARKIQRASSRMNRLIGDLLDVASIEAGSLAVTCQRGDPRDVVAEAFETFESQALASGVTLTAEVDTTVSSASFDPARLLQVLVNLLSNAIKFTPRGGKVTLRLEGDAAELRFSVQDTGIGVPAPQLNAIFERFHQVKLRDARGSGLGLYISKCIVQGHAGRIWAESTAGEGSTFRFTLPVETHRESRRPPT